MAADRQTPGATPVTAHPEYAYNPRQGAWSIARYHAVLDTDLTVGRFRRSRGDALCKPRSKFWGLEETKTGAVDCPHCVERADRYGVILLPPKEAGRER